MKKTIALILATAAVGAAQAQVGVSISVRQPGVYGRIDIGGLPPPPLVLAQPVLIAPPRVAVPRRPIYLYVSPNEQQNWGRYCGRYAACGQPVYFVQERWVHDRYVERHPGWNRGQHRGWDKHDDRGHGKDKGKSKGRDKHDRGPHR